MSSIEVNVLSAMRPPASGWCDASSIAIAPPREDGVPGTRASERAAFAVRQDEARGKVRVGVYSREGQRERVAFAVVRGYGVLARGDDPGAQIGAAAALPRESSLAQDERITAARQQLGAQDLTFVAPSGSVLIQRFFPQPLPGDLAVGLTGTAEGLSSKLFFQAAPEQAQRMKSSLPGGAGALVRFLPPEEFDELAVLARTLGFAKVASGPFVRSSYHADELAHA